MLCFPMLISSLPDANPLPHEHKIEVFVLFWPSKPLFSGILSTKSRFLCVFTLRAPLFGRFEHIICIFVLGVAPAALSQMTLVQFYRWGDAAAEALNRWDDSLWDRCQWAAGRRPLGEGSWAKTAGTIADGRRQLLTLGR